MAERTVNVNINYKVNTSDVDKAKAASIAAQKATDELRKSTQAYEQAAKKAGQEATKAQQQTAKSTRDLASEFNNLYTAVKTVIAAGIVREMVNVTLEMAKLSGQIDGVSRAFSRLPNATLLLNDLRKATHGTVTDLELMQKTLQAQNFKIPLQQLGTLFEFAATKAQQTGQEVNHLVDYIVSGIGYRSIKRLDDLGFTANRLKEALGGVSIQAASMGEVMNAVTTLMNEDLQKTGGYFETSATKVEQLETKWVKLKTTVSQFLTQPGLLRFYEKVIDLQTLGIQTIMGKGDQAIVNQQALKNVETFKEMNLTKEILADRQKTFDIVQQEINSQQQLIGRNNDVMKQLKERHDQLVNDNKFNTYAEDKELDTLSEQFKFYEFKNNELKESQRILKEYLSSLDSTTEEERESLGIIEAKRKEIETISNAIETSLSRGDIGAFGKLTSRLAVAQAELAELLNPLPENKLFFKDGIKLPKDTGKKMLKDLGVQTQEAGKELPVPVPVTPFIPEDNWDKLEQDFKERTKEIVTTGIDIFADQLVASEFAEVNSLQNRLVAIRDFYDEQQLLAGDNDRRKKELRIKEERETKELQKRIAEAEWRARKNAIIVDTAAGVAKNIATYPWPGWIIPAAITTAEGLSQLAIAEKNKPKFAKGVLDLKGPGTETSDSIDAKLSRGESVMTASETRRSIGILKAIRHNQLDDSILKFIDFAGGRTVLNDERIVNALERIEHKKQPDYLVLGRRAFRIETDTEGNRNYVRSKSI